MLSALFAVVVRYRWAILGAQLGLGVGYLVAGWLGHSATGWPFRLTLGVALLGLVLGVLAYGRPAPAAFHIRTAVPAFGTPVSPSRVLLCIGLLGVFLSNLASMVRDIATREEPGLLDLLAVVLVPLYLVALALWLRMGLVNLGVELRPDGVLDRQAAGTIFAPWEALALDHPAWPARSRAHVLIGYRRPELVRRRGVVPFGRSLMTGDNVDRWFLARAIQHYVVHPGHRAAIGTAAEYDRLRGALGGG